VANRGGVKKMKKLKQLIYNGLVLSAPVLLMACGNGDADNEPLNVQFVPTNQDGSMEAQAAPFAEYLTEQLDREVNVTLATDYSAIVEAMASGQVDVGIMPPAAYVQAREQGSAEALLTSELTAYDEETGQLIEGETTETFKGEILVAADSEIQSLEDLEGANIASLNPSSASGYIYPVAELMDIGLEPEIDYTVTTVSDIPSQMTAILNGQQDAAFVFQGARNVFQDALGDVDLFEELRVLYLTEGDIPNDAIAVHTDMDDDLKEQVREVFLNMPNDEAGQEAMSMWNHLNYNEANEEAYDTVKDYTDRVTE
jgi:phosphonate transport system substrate-binding protein